MKNVLIEAFIEGFTGPLRLLFDLITAVAKAIATVHSDFMNQTSRPAERPPSN